MIVMMEMRKDGDGESGKKPCEDDVGIFPVRRFMGMLAQIMFGRIDDDEGI